jgi:hypothetical protein
MLVDMLLAGLLLLCTLISAVALMSGPYRMPRHRDGSAPSRHPRRISSWPL